MCQFLVLPSRSMALNHCVACESPTIATVRSADRWSAPRPQLRTLVPARGPWQPGKDDVPFSVVTASGPGLGLPSRLVDAQRTPFTNAPGPKHTSPACRLTALWAVVSTRGISAKAETAMTEVPATAKIIARLVEAMIRPWRHGSSIYLLLAVARPIVNATRMSLTTRFGSSGRTLRAKTMTGQCQRYMPYEMSPRNVIGLLVNHHRGAPAE